MLDIITYDLLIDLEVKDTIAKNIINSIQRINTLIQNKIFIDPNDSYIEDELLTIINSEDLTSSYIQLGVIDTIKKYLFDYINQQGIELEYVVSIEDISTLLLNILSILDNKDNIEDISNFVSLLNSYTVDNRDFSFIVLNISDDLIYKINNYKSNIIDITDENKNIYLLEKLNNIIKLDNKFLDTITANSIIDNTIPLVVNNKYINNQFKLFNNIEKLPYEIVLLYYILYKDKIFTYIATLDLSTFTVLDNNTFNIKECNYKIKDLLKLLGVEHD